MQIKELSLIQFRNFDYVERVEFPDSALLVAAAPNATGKTNFLESIVMLLRGKSWRATVEECAAWGADGFVVQGTVAHGANTSRVAVKYNKESRKLNIEEDGEPISPVTFYASYPMVLFLPDDTFLFYRGPAQRRNFFNQVLASQTQYLSAVVQYQRVLRQRNAALKGARVRADVEAWTDLLVEHATSVWGQRQMLVDFLESHISTMYGELTGEQLGLTVKFRPGAADPDRFRQIVDGAWEHENKYNYTMYGPHRDDFEVAVDGRMVQSVLSRGQMRGLTVAMKLTTYRFLKQTTKQSPIVLFDEVLSELDDDRQAILLHHLPKTQILLTCTTLPDSIRERENTHLLDLRSIITKQEERVSAAVQSA